MDLAASVQHYFDLRVFVDAGLKLKVPFMLVFEVSLPFNCRSAEFTDNVLKVAESLLSIKHNPNNAQFIRLLNDYGTYLAHIHESHPYLKPFIFCGQNIGPLSFNFDGNYFLSVIFASFEI